MATIALPRPITSHRSPASFDGSLGSGIPLEVLHSAKGPHGPVPNKHIPSCPPGPIPTAEQLNTPPASPAGQEEDNLPQSLLYPPDNYSRLRSGPVSIFKINASDLVAALDHIARQPLPDPTHVFPWFHGLHPHNHIQQTFFLSRRKSPRKTPSCLRGITVVKTDGDLTVSRLKGAIAPSEFLNLDLSPPEFIDIDPAEGFSVRNFQIQAAKTAMTSDIVVYGQDDVLNRKLAWDIAAAQQRWREKHGDQGHSLPVYNTFVCVSPFSEFEEKHPEIVAIDSAGCQNDSVIDLIAQERKEMYTMAKASEISHNVWLGPTPDPTIEPEAQYDILVECTDLGRLNPAAFRLIAEYPDESTRSPCIDFPSSGSILAPSWSTAEADGIIETCKWIYHLAHGTRPSSPSDSVTDFEDDDGDSVMDDATQDRARRPFKILIHCADGYTESTMLGIAYYSYSTGLPVPQAWLDLHTTKQRNFFAYTSDVSLLSALCPRLLAESPALAHLCRPEISALGKNEPAWFAGLDGSLPSRITEYMYLGNLTHANNPSLLKALGIGQILSVGETAMWRDGELEEWGVDNVCLVQGVQDNGIDPLTSEFERCLEFIDRGRKRGTATLVHCRVGVSRSATIVIAEVMRSMDMSFPRAYCFVRARRLNVIIQPHLRFAYELLKWEEVLHEKKGVQDAKRELEWGEIAREIALMNRPYAR
ncbi:tyrosine/serine/threonine protein phosphatase pps1 [Coniochaeta pulveracea]|uniref:Tyrosine/serine/threonine protein phosphatase pps1 n=1 Tax=Coniochaeta pulveracea TaxID=177199 RepID=A0A420Y4T0_9PEZI|nr:tyrosine/serine/threonine protein phosphatase pps1 [Coniochaeta pulveracea]